MKYLYINNKLVIGFPRIYVNGHWEYYDFVRIDNEQTDYIVTNCGSIYSLKTNKKLKNRLDTNGYVQIHLRHNNKDYYVLLHRLVAKTFIPNPENKPQVNHINGNKTKNNIDNLEWCTNDENMRHAIKNGLVNYVRGDDQGNNKYKTKNIHDVCKLLENSCLSRYEISRKTGVSYDTVNDILNYRSWRHISDQYNINNYNINCNFKYSEKTKSDIIKLLKLKKRPKDICDILNLPYNNKIISLIKRCRKIIM